MVFDGDWNGGERMFNLHGRQRLDLHHIRRIDEGREIELTRGSLERVDHYDFTRRDIVRWRSRLPSDEPFRDRELTYVLDYTYRNILDVQGDQFELWHDFGLPERAGVVESFSLHLVFDAIWNTPPISETRTDLQPGRGVIVRQPLVHAGGLTAPVYRAGYVVLIALAAAVAMLIFLFLRDESALGRFAPVVAAFDDGLLELRAEVAGAIWDADVGASEVAATLARMTQEGKITSRVERRTLHMRLEVPRHELDGYERHLANTLFFDGDETDTIRIRKQNKTAGIDFAGIIRPGIESAVAEVLPGWKETTKRFRIRSHVFTLLAALLLLAGPLLLGRTEEIGQTLTLLVLSAVFGLLACASAHNKARSLTAAQALLAPSSILLLPVSLLAFAAFRAYPAGRVSLYVLIAGAVFLLAIIRLALDLLRTRESREVIAMRKRVVALRKHFVEQLGRPEPALRDEWFPHLLAFGLGRNTDRWFRAFGGPAPDPDPFATPGSGASPSSAPSWSGGGGAFGGAGASGSWAAAAAALGGGVAQPSSSGESGGGSSSGGGGGGGW